MAKIPDEFKEKVNGLVSLLADEFTLEYADALFQYGRYAVEKLGAHVYGMNRIGYVRECLEAEIGKNGDVWELIDYADTHNLEFPETAMYLEILRYEARHKILDSYMLYIEKNRLPGDRFYLPRRKCLLKLGVVQSLQDLLDDKLDILSISLPPGTGKTTLEMFFHSAVMGWFPKDFSLFYSHSGDITKMYYNGVLNILTSDEYCWREIFPEHFVYATDAKREQIHVDRYRPFANLQTTSVGAKNAGKVRAGLFLLCDDVIGGIEEALNINMLDKLWNVYSVDARQRKTTDNSWPGDAFAKEVHICTRWSVHDIVGRLQRIYEGNDRCRFLAFPDIDPETGKSNFLYDFNGFDENFFHDQELAMDEISYRCLYKNDPIEREGLLYTSEELRYYAELPVREPDAVMAVCDTKSKGVDFLVLPVLYQYDNDYYLVDCICTDSTDYGVQYTRMANMIIDYRVQQCEFESNAGGDRVAFEVESLVREQGGRCNITTKPTETNKETRIIVNADWIKKNVLFKPKEEWGIKTDYNTFMTWLLSYSVAGKNKHDDVPDCMANFALFVQNKYRLRPSYVIQSPF